MTLQETVEVETPVTKKKVVLRGYITGRIKQAIEGVFLSSAELSSGDEDGKTKFQASGSIVNEATNKALELIVVSVDGATANVLDLVLDLPEEDYNFVKAEVDKIQRPLASSSS